MKEKEVCNVNVGLKSLLTPMGELYEHPKNARKHPERNLRSIAASLNEFGQQKAIVYLKNTGEILAGNGTFRAAHSLGWTHIAALAYDRDDKRALGYMEADNRTQELSEWDEELHAAALKELEVLAEEWEAGMEAVGWTSVEIAALIESNADALLEADDFKPLQDSKPGVGFAKCPECGHEFKTN